MKNIFSLKNIFCFFSIIILCACNGSDESDNHLDYSEFLDNYNLGISFFEDTTDGCQFGNKIGCERSLYYLEKAIHLYDIYDLTRSHEKYVYAKYLAGLILLEGLKKHRDALDYLEYAQQHSDYGNYELGILYYDTFSQKRRGINYLYHAAGKESLEYRSHHAYYKLATIYYWDEGYKRLGCSYLLKGYELSKDEDVYKIYKRSCSCYD